MFLSLGISRRNLGLFGTAWLCLLMGHAFPLHAKDFAVIEDRISASPPDGQGYSAVSGASGSVIVSPDLIGTFSIENSGNKEKVSGKVNADGGFAGRIRAGAGDKLKITIMTSADKKRIKKKVPPRPISSPSPHTSDTFARGQTEPLTQFPDPTPEIIIRYKGVREKGASGATAHPVNHDAEVSESGVLPPD